MLIPAPHPRARPSRADRERLLWSQNTLEYTLGYRLGAPRLYPRVYSGGSQSIPHMLRLYPIRFRVGYSLGNRGILWGILYMITINYKFNIEVISHVLTLWRLEYVMFHRVLTL